MLDRIKRIETADVEDRRVLVRADLNVPMSGGRVTDASRIEQALPLIRDLSQRGAKIVVMSHFGRPGGARVPEMSLRPVADAMARMLAPVPLSFCSDFIGDGAREAVDALARGGVCVLETCASTPERKPTTQRSPPLSPISATSMSTTPFPPRTAPTPPRRPSPGCCPLMPARR